LGVRFADRGEREKLEDFREKTSSRGRSLRRPLVFD
jgi:hypothetical protein